MKFFFCCFQLKNPDVDIEHFLHGSNPIFRKFIDDGLAELERAAGDNNQSDNKVLSENRFGMTKPGGKDPDYWMERLNALKVSVLNQFICLINFLVQCTNRFPFCVMQKNAHGADHQNDNRSSTENLNVNFLAQKSLLTQKEVNKSCISEKIFIFKRNFVVVSDSRAN